MDEKQLSIDIVGLAGAYSYALDCIEAELVNITNKHGKRVAYMSVCMAKYWNVENDALQDLAICALLHDNALTQYITEEVKKNPGIDIGEGFLNEKANLHCIYGENNIAKIPFKTNVSNVILYHHELANGKGPFKKAWQEVPLFARIIHLADVIDAIANNIKFRQEKWDKCCEFLVKQKGLLFDDECVEAFFEMISKETFVSLEDGSFESKLWEIVPRKKQMIGILVKILQISLRILLIINLPLQADTLLVLQKRLRSLQSILDMMFQISKKCIWREHCMISEKWRSAMKY